jgi:5'-nucleotidase (lipoprotein e(P4) family)
MKLKLFITVITSILPLISFAAGNNTSAPINASAPISANNGLNQANHSSCIPGEPKSSANYNATKWYRDSAERNAQYNQIFALGLEKVSAQVKAQKLSKKSWGVIMDIDETVLDNSQYEKQELLACSSYNAKTMYSFMEQATSPATPGAHNTTCAIQKMGGKVVLVTNRDGTFDDKIQNATIANLQNAGICFDNVVFAKGAKDSNKTPRFEAVAKGDYNNIISSGKIKPFKVLAYFGDNIQDFPNINQKDAIKQDPNGKFYQPFGQIYFSLPNPTYGSWEGNTFN